jgi:hypothetical protein
MGSSSREAGSSPPCCQPLGRHPSVVPLAACGRCIANARFADRARDGTSDGSAVGLTRGRSRRGRCQWGLSRRGPSP